MITRQSALPLNQLRRALLAWYEAHRRELPWRKSTDPYRVWVSEIMLQQTRVAAVLEHYARFLKRFPTVAALAGAREQSVLALWSGLGYYNRARRMHQAAKVIVRERGGQLPSCLEDWLELPGIGRYTAAAIASIAFGEAVAVVDGNVERVLARLDGEPLSNGAAWERAQSLLDQSRPRRARSLGVQSIAQRPRRRGSRAEFGKSIEGVDGLVAIGHKDLRSLGGSSRLLRVSSSAREQASSSRDVSSASA